MQKINLYQKRNFSEKFSATIDYVRQTWRPHLSMSLYLLLPLCVIQTVGMNGYYDSIMHSNGDLDPSWGSLVLVIVGGMMVMLMLVSMVYGLMRIYMSDDDISALTPKTFWPQLRHGLRRCPLLMLAGLAVCAVVVLLEVLLATTVAIMSGLLLAIVIIVLLVAPIIAILPLTLFPAFYLMEDETNVVTALAKAYEYGFKEWKGTFSFIFIMGVIIYTVSGITMTPGLIMSALKETLFPATFTGNGLAPAAYSLVQFILTLAANFVSCLAYGIMFIGAGFQYGNLIEVFESRSVDDGIDHFDELADKSIDDQETETASAFDDDIENFDKL